GGPSISHRVFVKRMDCRVKPGNDDRRCVHFIGIRSNPTASYADPSPCPSPTRGEGTLRRCIGRGTGSVISATRRRTDGCPPMEHRPRCVPSPLVGEGQGGGCRCQCGTS